MQTLLRLIVFWFDTATWNIENNSTEKIVFITRTYLIGEKKPGEKWLILDVSD